MSAFIALRTSGSGITGTRRLPRGALAAAAVSIGALLLGGCASVEDGHARFAAGDYEGAEPLLRSSFAACREDRACELLAALQLGRCQLALEELRDAEVSLRRALALARRSGGAKDEATASSLLAQLLQETHHYPEALEAATRADQLADGPQLLALRAEARGTMSMATAGMGNPDGSLLLAQEAETLSRQIGQPAERGETTLRLLSVRAAMFRRAGDCPQAEKRFHEILASTYGQPGDRAGLEAHLGLARCARHLGHPAVEREELSQALSAMREEERTLRGKTLAAWRQRTLPLQAAEEEAAGVIGDRIPAGEAYAFALLYDADGDGRAALRAAARVPAASPDEPAARALSQPIRERARIVQGRAVWLRQAPEPAARASLQLSAGSWVELLPHKGSWLRVRAEKGSGWLQESQAGASLRPVTEGDLLP